MKAVQIGLGGWGKNHVKILKNLKVLSAICDINPNIANQYSKEYNVSWYDSVEKMIQFEKPDIAIVVSPTCTHYDIASLLLDHGVHVLVEKPFTSTVMQGRDLISKARKNDVIITCGYIERFNPVTQFIAGISDMPTLLEFHRESRIPSHIKDAGIVLDTMVHDIETACHIYKGYPINIQKTVRNIQGGDFEDMAVATLEFENGIANIVANWNTDIKMRTVHATFPSFVVRGDFVKKEVKKILPGSMIEYDYSESNPLEMELYHFIKCVEDGLQPEVTPHHANTITEIANMILHDKIVA